MEADLLHAILAKLAEMDKKVDSVVEFVDMVKEVAGPMMPAANGSPRPW